MYHAIPLADKGFVPADEIRNPVRWYVAHDDQPQLYGPYRDMETADRVAAAMNEATSPYSRKIGV